MSEIVLLADKDGQPLTPGEADQNLQELDRRTGHGWNDLVQEVVVRAGTNAPQLMAFRGGIVAHSFAPNTVAECFANFHMRHAYIPGQMVYPHVHWSVNTASSGRVRWGIEYTIAQRADGGTGVVFGQPETKFIEVDVPAGSQYTHFVSEAEDGHGIDGAGLDVDALILCRFFRDAEHPNDTFPDDVFLLTVDIHYPADVLCTPMRFPPFDRA